MTRLSVGDRAEGLVGIYTGMRGTVIEDKGETQGYMVRFDLPLGHATRADPEPYWLLDDEVKPLECRCIQSMQGCPVHDKSAR